MATDSKPTNEAIIGLLERVLAEIEALKAGQNAIAAEVRRLSETAGR